MQIITNTPIWVWPLLVLLIVLGVRASRTRWVPVAWLLAFPFLGLLGVRTVADWQAGSIAWILFGVSWAASVLWGQRKMQGWVIDRIPGRVHLKGEWVTLIAMMALFWANFAVGVLQAVAPEFPSGTLALLLTPVLGLASGQFAARAVFILRQPRVGTTS